LDQRCKTTRGMLRAPPFPYSTATSETLQHRAGTAREKARNLDATSTSQENPVTALRNQLQLRSRISLRARLQQLWPNTVGSEHQLKISLAPQVHRELTNNHEP